MQPILSSSTGHNVCLDAKGPCMYASHGVFQRQTPTQPSGAMATQACTFCTVLPGELVLYLFDGSAGSASCLVQLT
jgi:lipoate synthase